MKRSLTSDALRQARGRLNTQKYTLGVFGYGLVSHSRTSCPCGTLAYL
jgi:hypothetical protein